MYCTLFVVNRSAIHTTRKLQNERPNFIVRNGTLLAKFFCPIVRKNCSSDQEKLLKFETEGQEFAKFLRSVEQFIQRVKVQNNFW